MPEDGSLPVTSPLPEGPAKLLSLHVSWPRIAEVKKRFIAILSNKVLQTSTLPELGANIAIDGDSETDTVIKSAFELLHSSSPS